MSEETQVKTTAPREQKKCTVDGCKRKNYRAKGFCNVHYKKWRHHDGLPFGRYKICTKEGCRKPRAGLKGSVCAEHAGGEAKAA